MAIDFSVEPEFQQKLDWINEFMREEIEPFATVFRDVSPYDKNHRVQNAVVRPLQKRVQEQGLWACHLGPELGGQGYGQVKLALINEILGRSHWAPSIFGCQAPDSGNAEILAHYGSEAQKKTFLQPLLDGEIVSTYSMTEPQGGADPALFTCRADRDGNEWVINGEKWFASNYRYASFLIVMLVTNPDVDVYRGSSMLLVPANAPGLELIRHVGSEGEAEGDHAYLRFNDVRVPLDNLLGEEGQGFMVAQTRLGGGRLHHGMRSVGQAQRALDMMCERALSRTTRGKTLAKHQSVREKISNTWIALQQFRLQVLYAAWVVDQYGGNSEQARLHIAAVKVETPKILIDTIGRAMHLHGALGITSEMPLARSWMMAPAMGLADGPTEVHENTVAGQVLKQYTPVATLFPSEHIPSRFEEYKTRYKDLL
ncbi:MAG: acyl-CoA dehydrogenase [Bacteroidia bacterium]|jgi:acyl-CoA dehydrogenase